MLRLNVLFGSALASLVLALSACDSSQSDTAQESASSQGASEGAGEGTAPPPPQLPGQIVRAFAGTQLPPVTVEDAAGNSLDLGALDQPVLLNLWATWCAPCREEMPSLDNLAGELEGEIKVLTISQDDARTVDQVAPFFEEFGFQNLEQWLDPQTRLGAEFADGVGLPITILFDAEGKELLRVAGGFEWDSEEAIAQVKEAIAAAES